MHPPNAKATSRIEPALLSSRLTHGGPSGFLVVIGSKNEHAVDLENEEIGPCVARANVGAFDGALRGALPPAGVRLGALALS
jgi:hypothetical protein